MGPGRSIDTSGLKGLMHSPTTHSVQRWGCIKGRGGQQGEMLHEIYNYQKHDRHLHGSRWTRNGKYRARDGAYPTWCRRLCRGKASKWGCGRALGKERGGVREVLKHGRKRLWCGGLVR